MNQGHNEGLQALKARYRIGHAWTDLNLPGKPSRCCCSPFRDEQHPSFSVYDDGLKWKDHAAGDGGDVVDFIQKALGVDTAEAIGWFKEKAGYRPTMPDPIRREPQTYHGGNLRAGNRKDRQRLAALRGLSEAALALAERRHVLKFGTLYKLDCWAITDPANRLTEYRRLDGRRWPAWKSLPERKAHCVGSGKAFPVGLEQAAKLAAETGSRQLVLVEGAPDLLAAYHLILTEGKEDRVFPVAMLGAASHRIDPKAKPLFKGLRVRIFPHADDAGMKACVAWASEIRDAGAEQVDAFDLSGIETMEGQSGKDLNDLVNLSADCWEATPKFRGEVMP